VGQLAPQRASALRSALRLEYLSIGWSLAEAALAVAAGVVAGSAALIAFGGDSVVESLSGAVLVWRLRAERQSGRARSVERRARRGVALSLWLLALYVVAESVAGLLSGETARSSPVGIGLAAASLGVMWLLAGAKRTWARRLHSHALEADAVQTQLCWRLSAILLVGLGLNAALGWWWADPGAALALCVLIVVEGAEAWREPDCC
jgi:divalent metal cation (Fe/Co/Zn/Cd) transporter